jgi:hypothetical protein
MDGLIPHLVTVWVLMKTHAKLPAVSCVEDLDSVSQGISQSQDSQYSNTDIVFEPPKLISRATVRETSARCFAQASAASHGVWRTISTTSGRRNQSTIGQRNSRCTQSRPSRPPPSGKKQPGDVRGRSSCTGYSYSQTQLVHRKQIFVWRLVELALVWPHVKSDNDAHVDHAPLRAIRAYKWHADSCSRSWPTSK